MSRMLDLLSFRGMVAGDTGFEPAHTGLKGRSLSQYALSPSGARRRIRTDPVRSLKPPPLTAGLHGRLVRRENFEISTGWV